MTPLETQLKEENELLRIQNEELLSRLGVLNQSFEAYKAQKEKEQKLLEQRAQLLEDQVKVLLKRLYGASSEKTQKAMDGQVVMEEVVRLFNEAEVFEEEMEEEASPSKTRKTKKGHRITDIFLDLPEKEVLYRIPEDERVCSECGGELQVVGVRHNRYEIEYVPSKVNLLNIKQETCSCPRCSKEKGETMFVEPKVPEPVLQHSYASASSVAQVMFQKFVQGVPLHRQVKEWQSMGVNLSRGTLSSWVVKTAHEWFMPLLDEFKRSLNQEEVLHADETPVQVLDEEGKKNEAKSYMWVLATGSFSNHPIRYFEYAPSRSQEMAQRLLSGYRGYLVTDDYPGYNRLTELRRCSCWAHVRRKFMDVPTSSKDKRSSSIAGKALGFINDLFTLERTLSVMSPDERKEVRLQEAVPLLDGFWVLVDAYAPQVLPQSMLGRAFSYAQNNKDRLMTVLLDGRIGISNAIVENAIRPFAVGRKNWLFAGSPKGARASACVYSLVETAKANDLDPFLFLRTLLEDIPGSDYRTNPETMERLMPWSDYMQSICAVPARNTSSLFSVP